MAQRAAETSIQIQDFRRRFIIKYAFAVQDYLGIHEVLPTPDPSRPPKPDTIKKPRKMRGFFMVSGFGGREGSGVGSTS